ncbi:MFS transporter [Bacillus sp. 7894-2]|uniref:MFS transporter n=1 Tax=Bacillus sp. 7894-2 TaxID=2021695 RepID=UPI000BA7236A|nr:MFS transporter [Bacillus sp. 7894-2]PAE24943.1 hypothetical protein CHI10_10625 [Bacillus sp. 7894-2]
MKFKTFNSTIRIRLFLIFLSSVSTMSVLPYLIIYLSGKTGNLITGFLFLGVMIAHVGGSILGGFASDRIGRKKIILLAEFIMFIGFTGAAFVHAHPYLMFAAFVFIQFSSGAANPVYQALIIDVSLPEERKTIYSYSYWVRNTGIAVGSMAGAFLFFDYLFYLLLGAALSIVCSFLITAFFIQETYIPAKANQSNRSTSSIIKAYRNILAHRFFTVFSIASLLIVSVEEQLTNYIGVHLANKIGEPVPLLSFLPLEVDGVNMLGILKTENTILIVCFTMMITAAVKKYNDRYVFLAGLLLFFTGYTVVSFSTSPLILILAMFIASIGEMLYIPVQQTMLAGSVPDHARSSYMALYTIAMILGVSAAGIFMIVSNWMSPMIMTTLIGSMGIVSILLFYQLTKTEDDKRVLQLPSENTSAE